MENRLVAWIPNRWLVSTADCHAILKEVRSPLSNPKVSNWRERIRYAVLTAHSDTNQIIRKMIRSAKDEPGNPPAIKLD